MSLRQRGDDGLVHAGEKHQRQRQREYLRQRIAPPHQIAVAHGRAIPRQHIGDGDQEHQLPDDGRDHGVHGLPQRLEGAAQRDARAGHAEAQGDDAQGGYACGQHHVAGVKEPQQRIGYGPKQHCAEHHDAAGVQGAALDGGHHAAAVLSAVVVGHDGDHAVVQAENGHEDKGVQLEIDAEGGGCRLVGGVVGDEDLVHQERHHRADGDHDNAGQADGVDLADEPPVGAEAPQGQGDVRVLFVVEVNSQRAAAELADDGGDGGAGHAHFQSEDEDGVENDVDDSAQPLGVHAEDRPPGALQEPLDRTETGRHGFIYGQIKDGETKIRWEPFNCRSYINLGLAVKPEYSEAKILDVLAKQMENMGTQNIYRIILSGHMANGLKPDFSGLMRNYRIYEIVDNTLCEYDLDKLHLDNEDNLLGKFIERFADAEDEISKHALKYGVEAILATGDK